MINPLASIGSYPCTISHIPASTICLAIPSCTSSTSEPV
nr:MAG TPA: hypothetical protein [Caudoviricetes sp.]